MNILRRGILKGLIILLSLNSFAQSGIPGKTGWEESNLCNRIEPVGRILELPGWYVWGASPILGEDGKVHLFFARWKASAGFWSWINKCEIAHAVADSPEGPYEVLGTVLEPSGPGKWDAYTCHNPTIHKIKDRYYIFYMGSSDGTVAGKAIGYATSKSLYGPWEKSNKPIVVPGDDGEWDDYSASNPAFLAHPNGEFWMYYKAWDAKSWKEVHGNRKYGIAIAKNPEGPYIKYEANPVIDYSKINKKSELEDAYVYVENDKIKMIARSMGNSNGFTNEQGILIESIDGIKWSSPKIAYYGAEKYGFAEEDKNGHLHRKNRFERPQILMIDGKPAYLFCSIQGGKYQLSSNFVFKLNQE